MKNKFSEKVSFNKEYVKKLSRDEFISEFSKIYPNFNLGKYYDYLNEKKIAEKQVKKD